MGTFSEHLNPSQSNLQFLSKISSSTDNFWDWQVTVCFYSALHLINAHIVNKTQSNYLTHKDVEAVLNPNNLLSVARLDIPNYIAYIKLLELSRRSRYLLNENFKKGEKQDIQKVSLTYSKHFRKAIIHLDTLIAFISKEYNIAFNPCEIKCMDLQGINLTHFKLV